MIKYKQFTKEEISSWPLEHKKCRGCQEVLHFSNFTKNPAALFGLDTKCRECRKPQSQIDWAKRTREQNLLASAKHRAKKNGLPFNLELSDIVIPERCPVLDVPISPGPGWYAPSVDKKIPSLGYVKGNITIMSKRANTLKNNMGLYEVEKLFKWMDANLEPTWVAEGLEVTMTNNKTGETVRGLGKIGYTEIVDVAVK